MISIKRLIQDALKLGRSPSHQIERWAHIGATMEDNPDLNYDLVKGIEGSIEDIEEGRVEPYSFG